MKSAKENKPRKTGMLFKLAVKSMTGNKRLFGPYLFAGGFAVFAFFVMASIVANALVSTLPHAGYAMVMMEIGLFLLGIIMVPFIAYTHGFLIKQRYKEMALYSVLGLEKIHIARMMIYETLMVYGMVMISGCLSGLVLGKLLFMVMMHLSGLDIHVAFQLRLKPLLITALFFLGVYGMTLVKSIWEVFRSGPLKMMDKQREIQHKPKFAVVRGLIGLAILAWGYEIAITAVVNSAIFLDFFLAVFLVIIGTYMTFRSGLHLLMMLLKKRKSFYYQANHFIPISGIHQRINHSSASLSNLCIFSTMVIITLMCTLALFSGRQAISDFMYPNDMEWFVSRDEGNEDVQAFESIVEEKTQGEVPNYRMGSMDYTSFNAIVEDNQLKVDGEGSYRWIYITSYDNFVGVESSLGRRVELEPLKDSDSLYVYSTGKVYDKGNIQIGNERYTTTGIEASMGFDPRAALNRFNQNYYLITKDEVAATALRNHIKEQMPEDGLQYRRGYYMNFNPEVITGEKEVFVETIRQEADAKNLLTTSRNGINGLDDVTAMTGGLLFLGLFCCVIFMVCFVIIMYYKQISEGYDDRDQFIILQKVGLSDKEVRQTILRQIMVVFFLPLFMACLHSAAAIGMISNLFATVGLYDTGLVIRSGIIVSIVYLVIYGISYTLTGRVYYRIVRRA